MINYHAYICILIAYPDVVQKRITSDHEFIVLACDGIWDVLTNQEVVTFVRSRIAQGMQPDMVSTIYYICTDQKKKHKYKV